MLRAPGPVEILRQGGSQLTGLPQIRELHKVELAGGEENRQESQQQRYAADHRVQEELRRGLCAPFAAPDAHQEKRRNQTQLPEDEPVHEIQRRERAEQSGLEEKHQSAIDRPMLLVVPGSDQ